MMMIILFTIYQRKKVRVVLSTHAAWLVVVVVGICIIWQKRTQGVAKRKKNFRGDMMCARLSLSFRR